jgi:hypothetical protein
LEKKRIINNANIGRKRGIKEQRRDGSDREQQTKR